jgi:hypothetical protein
MWRICFEARTALRSTGAANKITFRGHVFGPLIWEGFVLSIFLKDYLGLGFTDGVSIRGRIFGHRGRSQARRRWRSCADQMGGSGVEGEEGGTEGFACLGEGREGGDQDLLQDFEGSAFDALYRRLGLGFAGYTSRRPGFIEVEIQFIHT